MQRKDYEKADLILKLQVKADELAVAELAVATCKEAHKHLEKRTRRVRRRCRLYGQRWRHKRRGNCVTHKKLKDLKTPCGRQRRFVSTPTSSVPSFFLKLALLSCCPPCLQEKSEAVEDSKKAKLILQRTRTELDVAMSTVEKETARYVTLEKHMEGMVVRLEEIAQQTEATCHIRHTEQRGQPMKERSICEAYPHIVSHRGVCKVCAGTALVRCILFPTGRGIWNIQCGNSLKAVFSTTKGGAGKREPGV